jgi:hypothetical protein
MKEEADHCEKLGVPIQKLVEKISDYMPERTAVLNSCVYHRKTRQISTGVMHPHQN